MRRDHENRTRPTTWNVDDPQVSPGARLAERDARSVPSRSVLDGPAENVLHLSLVDVVVVMCGAPVAGSM
jgi:hypothetical protein